MHFSDAQLLARYLEEKSEDAFSELVRRHFNLVYGAASRQAGGDLDLARDITQTVFVDLARKAGTLRDRTSLAGWLYTGTQFAGAKLIRGESRRRLREQRAIVMHEPSADPEINWEQLRPVIDRALQELNGADREAVLLRYFEQREFRAVGEVFGISEDGARKRVERALNKLREILGSYGLTSSISSLTAVLEGQVMPVVSPQLVASIAGAAWAVSGTSQLAGSAVLIQFMTTKSALVVLGVVALAGTLSSISAHRTVHRLRGENEQAHRRQESSVFSPAAGSDRAELERLRRDQAELIRLRGEVARLRQEAQEASLRARTTTRPIVPTAVADPGPGPEQPLEPVQVFIANAEATLSAGQGLVFGGWSTTPGKRVLIFIEPSIAEQASPGRGASILLQGKFVEVPDDALAVVGLDALKTETKATSAHNVLEAGRLRAVLTALEQMAGVDILSSPRVQTGQGIQASLSITQQRTVAGEEYSIGPSLDVEPRITADGSSINLTLSARYRKVTGE